jgi:uncharacterized protein (TIGR03382 family)
VVTSVFGASSSGAATASVTVSSPSNYNFANDTATVALNGTSAPKGGSTNGGCSSAGGASLPALVLVVGFGLARRRRVLP